MLINTIEKKLRNLFTKINSINYLSKNIVFEVFKKKGQHII